MERRRRAGLIRGRCPGTPAVRERLVPWLADGDAVRIARAHADWAQPEMAAWLPC